MITSARQWLACAAALFGVLAAVAGTPYRTRDARVDVALLAGDITREKDHVTAIELAEWIRDCKPGLRVIDVRGASEFETGHIPTAEPIELETLMTTRFRATDTVVLYSEGGVHAGQAWVLLRALGYRQVFFLRDGLYEWLDEVMNPTLAPQASPDEAAAFERASSLSHYFEGRPRIGVTKPEERAEPRPDHRSTPLSAPPTSASVVRRRGC